MRVPDDNCVVGVLLLVDLGDLLIEFYGRDNNVRPELSVSTEPRIQIQYFPLRLI